MTAADVIARVNARWPHAHGEAVLTRLVQQADDLLRAETLGLPARASADAPLAAQPPYEALYEHFVVGMLAQMDGEYSRYNAEMALYTSLCAGCARAHRRANLPQAGEGMHGYD